MRVYGPTRHLRWRRLLLKVWEQENLPRQWAEKCLISVPDAEYAHAVVQEVVVGTGERFPIQRGWVSANSLKDNHKVKPCDRLMVF